MSFSFTIDHTTRELGKHISFLKKEILKANNKISELNNVINSEKNSTSTSIFTGFLRLFRRNPAKKIQDLRNKISVWNDKISAMRYVKKQGVQQDPNGYTYRTLKTKLDGDFQHWNSGFNNRTNEKILNVVLAFTYNNDQKSDNHTEHHPEIPNDNNGQRPIPV